ncbi:MAG: class II histone deacetylase, partial [Pseudomonadota bacterium]
MGQSSERNTGLVWDERTMWHTTGPSSGIFSVHGQLQPGTHVENPETKRRLKNLLDGYGVTAALT